jgi:hypothetical protein
LGRFQRKLEKRSLAQRTSWLLRPASAKIRRDLVNGKGLFGSGAMPGTMKLVKSTVTESGNIIATYERAGPLKTGEFDVDEETGSMDVIERNKGK